MKKLLFLIICIFLTSCGLADGRDRRGGDLGEPTPIPTSVAAGEPIAVLDISELESELALKGRSGSGKTTLLTGCCSW